MPSANRPIIGVNMDLTPAQKNQRAQMLSPLGYADAIVAAGGLPLFMPPIGKDKEIAAFLDLVDGFLLTGGLDLDPRKLGQPMHTSVQLLNPRREESDRLLVRQIIARQMPVLGVGLGMQQLNIACGGSLFTHLPEDMPRSLPHYDRTSTEAHRHLVLVQPQTRLEEIYGVNEIFVTSNHHQGIKQVGDLFRVCAKAPDGVIEAIETYDGNWFAMGVQWHPEAESASALELQLFECFLQAALRGSNAFAAAA
jgi:putative glutamine amidotransferase